MPSLEQILEDVVPEGTSVTTPSGMRIFYCPEPRHYKVNGVEVPSVSTILKILNNEALPWWGMKVGMVGTLKLAREGHLFEDSFEATLDDLRDKDHPLLQLMKEHRLTTNHQLNTASDRGTNIHLALERWCDTGSLPDPEAWPEEERGYIRGLIGFLEAVQPTPIHSELMVGSEKHKFAGRFDLFAETEEKEVRPTPRKKRQVPAGRGIWDLKSRAGKDGKGIYPKDCLQTAGYRIGLEESHLIRSDYEAVVAVRDNGGWDIEISDKKPWQYLAARGLWEALQ